MAQNMDIIATINLLAEDVGINNCHSDCFHVIKRLHKILCFSIVDKKNCGRVDTITIKMSQIKWLTRQSGKRISYECFHVETTKLLDLIH